MLKKILKLFLKNVILSIVLVFEAALFHYLSSISITVLVFMFIFNFGLLELMSKIYIVRKANLTEDLIDEVEELCIELIEKLDKMHDKVDISNNKIEKMNLYEENNI